MLKGISPLISPNLLCELSKMGHGDEIVIADALFPAHSINNNVIRLDGVQIEDLLDGLMKLFPIDTYVDDSIVMVTPEEGDADDPELPNKYRVPIDKYCPNAPKTVFTKDRFEFYERARKAYCVVLSGSVVKYGNIILKKGV